MFSKQNLLATLAATLTMFLVGWLLWGLAMADFFAEHSLSGIMKPDEEMEMLHIFLGNLVAAFAMCTIYGKWARGHHSAGQGFQFGAWFGVFVGIGMGLVWMGTSNMMDMTGHLVEAALDIVYYGIVGMVIAIVFKATAPKEA